MAIDFTNTNTILLKFICWTWTSAYCTKSL